MKPKVKVAINPSSLDTIIQYEGDNLKISNEISLILSSISDQFKITASGIVVPWHSFKKALVAISKQLRKERVDIQFDDFALKLVNEFVDDKRYLKTDDITLEIDPIELESILSQSGFSRQLTSEQQRDTLRLLSLKHGANFSVPGAGKTTTILAVFSVLRYRNIIEKLFVVSPINAFISWEDEIAIIFRESPLKVLRLTPQHLKNFHEVDIQNWDMFLVNYEKLRRDIRYLYPFFIQNNIHLVLDESHRIKGGQSNLSYQQIIKLSDLAKRRDILSGTPMPQSYEDLNPQFDFLWADKVLPNLSYVSDEDDKITAINRAISSKFVRTTKNELGLRDPVITYQYIEMGSIQAELYKLFKSEAARVIAGMDRNSKSYFRNIGRSVVRLLQAATNPMLLGTEDEYTDNPLPIPPESEVWELLDDFVRYEKPVKIQFLKYRVTTILNQDPDSKVVVWSYFIRNILLLERVLEAFNPVSIYGNVPSGSDEDETKREGRIRKFHEDSTCRVLIANPQACGEGISLHKVCHHAIYLDRNFNAAHFLQSIDRIHRLGLDDSVQTNVEILISKHSIDELLIARLNQKTAAMGRVLDDPYLLTLAYDPADILDIANDGIDETDAQEIYRHILEN